MNNGQLATFDFNGVPVRVIDRSGEPWWVAADVCRVLGIVNPRDAVSGFDEDDVAIADIIDSLGRSQAANVVSEAGLYSLILCSRKPEARAFKRWVTKEVLPAIRRHGRYETPVGVASPRSVFEALEAIAADSARARAGILEGSLDVSAAQTVASLCAQELRAWELRMRAKPDRALISGLPVDDILRAAASGMEGDAALGLDEIIAVGAARDLCGPRDKAAIGSALGGRLGANLEDERGRWFRVYRKRTAAARLYEFSFSRDTEGER